MMTAQKQPRRAQRDWWDRHPLVYDAWGGDPIPWKEGTREYFEEVDRRFFAAAKFAGGAEGEPFASLLPYKALKGRRVLEIGCGAGTHVELLVRHGAVVSACDRSSRALALTTQRARAKGFDAVLARGEATDLPFRSGRFDFVWSWGVIHHSRNVARAVGEMARVLRPGGEARVMVYHRDSIGYWLHVVLLKGILLGGLARRSVTELANAHSDGDRATYWTRGGIREVFAKFFDRTSVRVCGQRCEALPIPGRAGRVLLAALPEGMTRALLDRVGAFLFVTARRS